MFIKHWLLKTARNILEELELLGAKIEKPVGGKHLGIKIKN